MALHSEHYFQLMNEQLGGVNEANLETFFYWNNPFALKHWTMNVIEILLIAGAVWALVHALHTLQRRQDPAYLCLWFASIIYLLVIEVPLYFPQLIGGEPILVFTHNEFSAGMMYNMTPFYIVALYPALLYTSYLMVENAGLFERRHGLLIGALCVGVIHSCFYEIFDHYGPQFGWWAWNYGHPHVSLRLASVPLSSIVVFSLTPPMVAALLARVFFVSYVCKRQAQQKPLSALSLVVRTLLVGILIPVLNALLPTAWFTSLQFDPQIARVAYFAIIALALLVALTLFAKNTTGRELSNATQQYSYSQFPTLYFVLYIACFAGLWLYALPEYFASRGGMTARGTPVGSLGYTLACFVCAAFFVYKSASLPNHSKMAATIS